MNIRSLLTGLNQHIAVAMRVWQPQTAALTRLELAPAMQTEPCETAVAGNARTTQIGVEQTEDLAAHHAGSGPRTGTRGLDVRVPRLLAYPHGSGIELKPRPGRAGRLYLSLRDHARHPIVPTRRPRCRRRQHRRAHGHTRGRRWLNGGRGGAPDPRGDRWLRRPRRFAGADLCLATTTAAWVE